MLSCGVSRLVARVLDAKGVWGLRRKTYPVAPVTYLCFQACPINCTRSAIIFPRAWNLEPGLRVLEFRVQDLLSSLLQSFRVFWVERV